MADEKPTATMYVSTSREKDASGEGTVPILDVATVKRIVRRMDWRLLPLVTVVYVFCYLDRSNIGNAKLLNIEQHLDLSQAAYSWGLSVFYIGYILFEVPSNMMLKRSRPSRWLGFIIVVWGSLCICMAANTGTVSLMIIRFLLGAAEAGFFPGVVFYLTLWYDRSEMCTRLAIFYSASSIAGALGGILAYSISNLEGVANLAAWRWLFIIEGIPTVLLGVVVYYFLADRPDTVHWLNEDEKQVAIQRLHQTQVTDEVDNQGLNWEEVKDGFTDFTTYLYAMVQITMVIPTHSIAFLLSTVIKELGFGPIVSQLMTAPLYFISAMFCIAIAIVSDRFQERGFHIVFSTLLGTLGFLLTCFVDGKIARYIVLALVVSGVNGCHPVNLSWATMNTLGKSKAAVVSAVTIALGNVGGMMAGQMYRNYEAPRYLPSHLANAGCMLLCCTVTLVLKTVLFRANKRIEHFLDRAESDPTLWDQPDAIPPTLKRNRQFRFLL